MIIRYAEEYDLKDLTEIYNYAIDAGQLTADTAKFTPMQRRQWFDEHKQDSYPLLVAEIDGSARGYLTISPYRKGRQALRHTAEVSYYVHPDYRQRGIASALLEKAIALCPGLGIKNLFAILIETNVPSIRLLNKYGFTQWGALPLVAEFEGIEYGQVYYGKRLVD